MNIIKAQTLNLEAMRKFQEAIAKLPEDQQVKFHVAHLDNLTNATNEVIKAMEKKL